MEHRIPSSTNYYETVEFLGEGLTSQVYKAFRIDSQGYTRQAVALKILKSKGYVQILRKEFEKLQKVESPYCVRVLAWENLKKGPALVLELIDGVSLQELLDFKELSSDLLPEIMAQVQRGLKSIHSCGLVHGDLSLKNILINRKGMVKLLDFGVLKNKKCQMGTPQFMSLESWRKEDYTPPSDLFSLGLIYENLKGPNKKAPLFYSSDWEKDLSQILNKNSLLAERPCDRHFLNLKTNKKVSIELGKSVQKVLAQKKHFVQTRPLKVLPDPLVKTQKTLGESQNHQRQKRQEPLISRSKGGLKIYHIPLFFILTGFFTLAPLRFPAEETSFLEVRHPNWLPVQINGLPPEFAPFMKKPLRPGQYRIQWGFQPNQKSKIIHLKPGKIFILKPTQIELL